MKYKIGDKIRVCKWDKMKKEFGLDSDGDIKCKPCFVKGMKKFCGKIFIVEKVFSNYYYLKGAGSFCFSGDTLEPDTLEPDTLEPVDDKKIVITTDGKTTLARLYEDKKVVKTAKAKCSPEDEFDFIAGAELAFERLTQNKLKKPIYYSGKVVCVEAGEDAAYTVGKIYEFVDGRVKINNGKTVLSFPVRSLDEWNNSSCTYAKFIELKE